MSPRYFLRPTLTATDHWYHCFHTLLRGAEIMHFQLRLHVCTYFRATAQLIFPILFAKNGIFSFYSIWPFWAGGG